MLIRTNALTMSKKRTRNLVFVPTAIPLQSPVAADHHMRRNSPSYFDNHCLQCWTSICRGSKYVAQGGWRMTFNTKGRVKPKQMFRIYDLVSIPVSIYPSQGLSQHYTWIFACMAVGEAAFGHFSVPPKVLCPSHRC